MRTTTHARPPRLASIRTAARLVLCVLMASAAHGTLVTVQSQTQEDMDALTAAVNLASAEDYSGHARVTLGTIEATMSRCSARAAGCPRAARSVRWRTRTD